MVVHMVADMEVGMVADKKIGPHGVRQLDMVADMEVEKRNFMRLLAGLMSTRNKRENIKF